MDLTTFRFLATLLPPEIIVIIDNHLLALYKKDSQRILLVAMSAVYSLREDDKIHFLRIGYNNAIWAFTNTCKTCGDIYRNFVCNFITGELTKIPMEKIARSHGKNCSAVS